MSRSLSPNFYRLGRWLCRQTLGRVFSLKVEGLEHLPARGPAIICPKHQRWEDIPIIGLALPPPLHYIAKVELFQYPFVRELLGAWGGVPVDRGKPPGDALVLQKAGAAAHPRGLHRPVPGRHLFPR